MYLNTTYEMLINIQRLTLKNIRYRMLVSIDTNILSVGYNVASFDNFENYNKSLHSKK